MIDLIISLCRDSFNLVNCEEYSAISIHELKKFSELLGKKMTKDEFYFFVKKCLSKPIVHKESSDSEEGDLLKPGNGKTPLYLHF